MKEIADIGKNIRKYRIKGKLTQLDLAAMCGLEESSIGRLENGNTNPTVKTLVKVATALNLKLWQLCK